MRSSGQINFDSAFVWFSVGNLLFLSLGDRLYVLFSLFLLLRLWIRLCVYVSESLHVCVWSHGHVCLMQVFGIAPAEFEKLTRCHAVKHSPAVHFSREEAALAVGDVVGYDSVKSVSWESGVIVLFVDSTAKVSKLVEKGVVIQDTFTTVSPLTNPATKVMISKAPY